MRPIVVTMWIDDSPEVVPDEMYATVIEQRLGVSVTDWTVEEGE